MYKKKIFSIITIPYVLLILISILGCASQEKEKIRNTESTSIQLLLTRNLMFYQNYNAAIEMFTYIRDENPDNIALKVETEYEIAFCYWKKRNLQQAQQKFEELIAFYDTNDFEEEIPTWPYFLSKKILADKILPEIDKTTSSQ